MQVEIKSSYLTPKFMEVEEDSKMTNLEYFESDWSPFGPVLKETFLKERRGILNFTE